MSQGEGVGSKPGINHIAIDLLIPYVNNARTHSDAQVAQIAASIKEFGFTNPVLIDGENGIIAGHGRVLAARKLGMTEVPTIELSHLSTAQKKAYILADNKLALNADWDDELLNVEFGELKELGFDLELTGFTLDEIGALIPEQLPDGLTDPDEVPEPPAEPVSKPGDVWLLGKHRIICGSSTDAATVEKLLNNTRPHLMVTDPPYGIEYNADWRNHALRADGTAIGGRAIGKVENDDIADWRKAWEHFPGEVAYVWHASTRTAEVLESLASCQFEARSLIIWATNTLAISRGHYHHQHEPCWYAVKKGKTGHWQGDRKQTTLWKNIDDVLRPDEEVFCRKIDAETIHAISGDETTIWNIPKPMKSETGHSTQKPVECMLRPIRNNSVKGDSVYEPFSGSGTTLIAAEISRRSCFAVELHPPYVDLAVIRWQNFTGKQAILESTGELYNNKKQ
jgi:DNA modification methylase